MNKYYTFHQNNSGGSFEVDDDVCAYVIIEANNSEQANGLATSVGIYFDGVEDEIDCECCGDRWNRAWEDDGKDEPMIYGDQAHKAKVHCIIHYLDGRKEEIGA